MGHIYGVRIPDASTEKLHNFLVSLSSFYARSSAYGYLTNGFKSKNVEAYIFVAAESRSSPLPHPDMEIVIEPDGLYINAFAYIDNLDNQIEARFGKVEFCL